MLLGRGIIVAAAACALANIAQATDTDRHWWSDYTTMATEPLKRDLQVVGADCYRPFVHGGWYGWWYLDFTSAGDFPITSRKSIEDAGARPVAYYDLGEVGDFAMLVDEQGNLIVHAWNWQTWKGQPGTAHWFGLESFLTSPDWAPYPGARSYDLPQFTTAAGTPVRPGGFYEAIGRRRLDGQVRFHTDANPAISDDVAERSGLAALTTRQQGRSDVVGGTGWVTVRQTAFDRANPQLREYHSREIAAFVASFRPAGIHIDNLADTDTLIPALHSFGDWSSSTFRDYLRTHLTSEELHAHGIADLGTFEIRDYLQQGYAGGDPVNSPHLNAPRWLDDLIWKAYLLHKVETGMAYGRGVYHAAKQAAAAEGLDCGVFGNVIPMFPGSELARDFCDVVHFEWLSQGRYGPLPELGLPPVARSAYVVRLGRAMSSTGYCWPSLYVPKRLSGAGHTNLHKVQAFECFANGGIMDYGQWYLDRYSPGTDESAGYINRFINRVAKRASGRNYAADIGLVYCPWTLIATIDGNGPVADLFLEEYKGWTDYLCNSHAQWDIVLGQDIETGALDKFQIVVLPSILALSDAQVEELARYVERGGNLVVTGLTGTRFGPERFLTSRTRNALTGFEGRRGVHWSNTRPGLAYLRTPAGEAESRQLAELLTFDGATRSLTTDAPTTVELNLWRSARGPGLILDLVNNDLKLESDTITDAPACTVTLAVDRDTCAAGVSRISWIRAGADGITEIVQAPTEAWRFELATGRLVLRLPSFTYYTMVFIE